MKRKLVVLMLCFVMTTSLMACGNADVAQLREEIEELKAEIDELEEENEELEEENDELKAQLKGDAEEVYTEEVHTEEAPQIESETWPDDTIIAFADKDMAAAVREITGINDRDITYGDVKGITRFEHTVYGYLSNSWRGSLEPLQYFTGLVELNIHGISSGGECVTLDNDLEPLKNLDNLQTLNISGCSNLIDISALGNLTNLKSLSIASCERLTDISALGNLTNLQALKINAHKSLEEVSVIAKLTGLSVIELNISGDLSLEDLGDLSNVKKLSVQANSITGTDALRTCVNMQELSLKGNGITVLDFLSEMRVLNDFYVNSETLQIDESLSYLQNYSDVWKFDEKTIAINPGAVPATEGGEDTTKKLF